MPGIVLVQEIFGLHYNFREFSIPWFAAFYQFGMYAIVVNDESVLSENKSSLDLDK